MCLRPCKACQVGGKPHKSGDISSARVGQQLPALQLLHVGAIKRELDCQDTAGKTWKQRPPAVCSSAAPHTCHTVRLTSGTAAASSKLSPSAHAQGQQCRYQVSWCGWVSGRVGRCEGAKQQHRCPKPGVALKGGQHKTQARLAWHVCQLLLGHGSVLSVGAVVHKGPVLNQRKHAVTLQQGTDKRGLRKSWKWPEGTRQARHALA